MTKKIVRMETDPHKLANMVARNPKLSKRILKDIFGKKANAK